MSTLLVAGPAAPASTGIEILHGVELEVASGEVHALMGPNGSGSRRCRTCSWARRLRGDRGIGHDRRRGAARPPDVAARAKGLFLAMQYPVAVPGVPVGELLGVAVRGGAGIWRVSTSGSQRSGRLDVADEFLSRGVNDEFSGGEQKRMETLQLAVLEPRFAVLDEIDSGLDVDALRDVSRRIEAMTEEPISACSRSRTTRVLSELRPTGCT